MENAAIGGAPGNEANGKSPRVLACTLCQQRKIKCDRNPLGCANCAKSRVACIPSTPAPARKRRRPRQELQNRLAHCEQLLKQYVSNGPQSSTTPLGLETRHSPQSAQWEQTALGTETPTIRAASIPLERHGVNIDKVVEGSDAKTASRGKLIQEDGGVRFMDSVVLGTIFDELETMQDMLDDDDSESNTIEASPAPLAANDGHEDLFLGVHATEGAIEDLRPAPGQVFRLWQIFVDRVNPVVKVVHLPTLQPCLADAANGVLPKNLEPLLFAIYTIAVVSLTVDESRAILGMPRIDALRKYSSGVRKSLIRIDFVRNAELSTVQALLLYLTSLKGRDNAHAVWTLSGVMMRLVQQIGLHRDGETLGLSPFETEIRRRVWWQAVAADDRCAIQAGMGSSMLPLGWNTQEPRNANDTDLSPSATQPIVDKEGPTDMVFSLITAKLTKFRALHPQSEPAEALTALMASGSTGRESKWTDEQRLMVENLRQEIATIVERYCDANAGGAHKFASLVGDRTMRKLGDLLEADAKPKPTTELNRPRDQAFIVGVKTLEQSVERHQMRIGDQFAWLLQTLFQVDIFAYVCGQLCSRHAGPDVDRAWRVVEQTYHYQEELTDMSTKIHSDIATFVLKAWGSREEALQRQTGIAPETPPFVLTLRTLKPYAEVKKSPPGLLTSNTSDPLAAARLAAMDLTGCDELMGDYMFDQQVLDQYAFDPPSLDWSSWTQMDSNES